MKNKIKTFFRNYFFDIGKIPSILLVLFCVTIIAMNLLANKTIFQNEYLALDGGIVITWVVVLIMDMVIAVYGPKIAIKMNIFGIAMSLLVSLIFYLVSLIPSGSQFNAFNQIIGGTWFIILSGAIAFIISSSLNAIINYLVSKRFKKHPEGKLAFSIRSVTSTFISQILDNFIFNSLAFMVFAPIFWNGFSWTPVQCICCALCYGAIELVIELVLFPLAYRIYKHLLNRESTKK